MPQRTARPSEQGVLIIPALEAEQLLPLPRKAFTHLPARGTEGKVGGAAGVRVPIPILRVPASASPRLDRVHDLLPGVAGDAQTYGHPRVEARRARPPLRLLVDHGCYVAAVDGRGRHPLRVATENIGQLHHSEPLTLSGDGLLKLRVGDLEAVLCGDARGPEHVSRVGKEVRAL